MTAPHLFKESKAPLSTYGEGLVNKHFIDDLVYNTSSFTPAELYCIAYSAYLMSNDAATCVHFRELMDYYRSIK